MSWWTTEQVAEYLGVTEQAIYDSRRRKQFPGNRGSQRGRRLMFPSEAIEAGKLAVEEGRDPDTPDTTDDATTAILWALEGIHKTLRAIHNELRAQRKQPEDHYTVTVNASGINDEEAIQAAVALTGGTFWIGKPVEIKGDEEE